MFNLTTIGAGLGFNANRLLVWGLGYQLELVIEKVEMIPARVSGGGGGGGGDQRRTYLFGSRNIQFTVSFRSSTAESTFINPQDIVRGKVLAKREPLLIKAKRG